jgi:4-hydroxy-3-methylbut-2-enyl diphosphate reductase
VSAPVVATALRLEQAALLGRVGDVRVVHTGMGPVRSGRWAAQVADVSGVLVAGLAGGLAAEVAPGDLVVASEVVGDGLRTPVASAPLLAGALRRRGLRVHLGPLAASRSIVGGPSRTALAAGGALAVDMESAALAPVAAGGPFGVVRAVVDTAAHPLLRPGTVVRSFAALSTLRRAAPDLADWAAALGDRQVLLAGPRSFCAGVERAVEIVERALHRFGAPVHVRRQIVHNAHVVRALEQRGAVFVAEVDEVPEGGRVVLAAHGVAPAVRADAKRRGLLVVDATCPLVAKVHAEVRRYTSRGDTVLLIGHEDHEEVQGTVGEAPGQVLVVADAAQAARVQPDDPERVAYAMQTTLAADEAEQVARVLRSRFPSLSAPRRDDICYATTNRQLAVREVAARSELVLVLGSANSSNSQRLVEVAERCGTPARLVDDAGDVDLRDLAGITRVGITAGASAPPHLVDELVHCLGGLGAVDVQSVDVAHEDILFGLPKEVS